ncbi:retrovirus-related pol polyprotein from transposon TNT 1-94 [Tanacetum coccineum]
MTIIENKWVFRNKLDENGVVSRNKARLVAQGYNQQDGIDYDETYAPVARLESLRIFIAYDCALDFKLFQMDVKSAFLNGFINEEKQTALAISTTEAEYVSAGKACQQALWMKQALIDYDRQSHGLSPSPPSPLPTRTLNPLLDNILNVPPRPLNPQSLQSHPSLDITLSLSQITPLDHIHDTPSPLSPPQPQPPIIGNSLFYIYHDYHGTTCIYFSHNRTLFFTLRDEMNIMFAHLEYLLTTAITSYFSHPP